MFRQANSYVLLVLLTTAASLFAHEVRPTQLSLFVGDRGTYSVTDPQGCTATITARSDDSTVAIVSPTSSPGPVVTQTFTVTALSVGKTTIEGTWRGSGGACNENGSYRVDVTVTAGCSYRLNPTELTLGPDESVGNPLYLDTQPGCPWTATSTAEWLRVSPASGSGPPLVIFLGKTEHTGTAPRSAMIQVSGQSGPAQSAQVKQEAFRCGYSFSATPLDFPASGGTGTFAVLATTGCTWNTWSNRDWVRITSGATGSGRGSGAFTVLPYSGERGPVGEFVAAIINTGGIQIIEQYVPARFESLIPASGAAGSEVTINGQNLGPSPPPSGQNLPPVPQSSSPADRTEAPDLAGVLGPGPAQPATVGAAVAVLFNGVRASVLSTSPTQIRAVVPGGATSGLVSVTTPGGTATSSASFNVTGSAPAGLPAINPGGIVDGASFKTRVAAGSIASVFGLRMATSPAAAQTLPLPTTLGGGALKTNHPLDIPTFFGSPGQANFQVPWELRGLTEAEVYVRVGSLTSNPVRFTLAEFAPAIFTTTQTGTGQGTVLIAATGEVAAPAGSIPGLAARPAARGEFLSIFCTGLGPVFRQPASGAAASATNLSETANTPTVTIGGVPATVSFSGLAPGFVGLYQVNVEVPQGATTGNEVPLVLNIGGVASNTVTIAIQ